MLKERIKAASEAFFEETKRNREHLHQWPELSHDENRTVLFLSEKLKQYGVEDVHTGDVGVGVVANIQGQKPGKGKVVCIRADIDALPIREQNTTSYCSKAEGKMHACGHDFVSSVLLSASKLLFDSRNEWSGIVKILFQRGEECAHPTLNKPGALLALEHGLLNAPRPALILGQHATPEIPFGKVGFFPSGQIGSMAAVDTITIKVSGGDGGHGARPFAGIDPVPAACAIALNLQVLLTRRTDPVNSPSVFSIGKIRSVGGAVNVLAKGVHLEGTLRTFSPDFRESILADMKCMVEQTAVAFGATAQFDWLQNTIALTNAPELNDRCRDAAIEFLGSENVMEASRRAGGEDFSFYQTVDGLSACFWRIGTGDPANGRYISDLHKDTFDVAPESMLLAPGLLAWLAIKELEVVDESTKSFQNEEEWTPQIGTNDGGWAI